MSIVSVMSTKASGSFPLEVEVRDLVGLQALLLELLEHHPRGRIGHDRRQREQPRLLVVPVVDVAGGEPQPGRIGRHDHLGSQPADLAGHHLAGPRVHLEEPVGLAEEGDALHPQHVGRGALLPLADGGDVFTARSGFVGTRGSVGADDVVHLASVAGPFGHRAPAHELRIVGMGEQHDGARERPFFVRCSCHATSLPAVHASAHVDVVRCPMDGDERGSRSWNAGSGDGLPTWWWTTRPPRTCSRGRCPSSPGVRGRGGGGRRRRAWTGRLGGRGVGTLVIVEPVRGQRFFSVPTRRHAGARGVRGVPVLVSFAFGDRRLDALAVLAITVSWRHLRGGRVRGAVDRAGPASVLRLDELPVLVRTQLFFSLACSSPPRSGRSSAFAATSAHRPDVFSDPPPVARSRPCGVGEDPFASGGVTLDLQAPGVVSAAVWLLRLMVAAGDRGPRTAQRRPRLDASLWARMSSVPLLASQPGASSQALAVAILVDSADQFVDTLPRDSADGAHRLRVLARERP